MEHSSEAQADLRGKFGSILEIGTKSQYLINKLVDSFPPPKNYNGAKVLSRDSHGLEGECLPVFMFDITTVEVHVSYY